MKFDNSVSVVKSQCYSNANQIELVLWQEAWTSWFDTKRAKKGKKYLSNNIIFQPSKTNHTTTVIRVGHKIVFVLFRFVFLPVRPASSRVNSLESFVSAVEEPDDLMKFDDEMLSPSHFVITSPSLVYKYSQHLGQLECLNWNSPLMIPAEQRLFSITNNLKVWLMGLNFFQLNISLFNVKQ